MMNKLKHVKILSLWFIIVIDFIVMFLAKEQLFTYFLLGFTGMLFTILFVLKQKESISADVRKAMNFSFEVGWNFLIVGSVILVVDMLGISGWIKYLCYILLICTVLVASMLIRKITNKVNNK